jgi:hypothetical protein
MAEDLRMRAVALVNALLNAPDLTVVSRLLSQDLHFHHDSAYRPVTLNSLDEFMSFWYDFQSTMHGGELKCRIKEALVDERQHKVLVVGEIASVNGSPDKNIVVETVEMLSFDEDGRICDIQDYRRRTRPGGGNED